MPIGDSRSRPSEAVSRRSDCSKQQMDDDDVLVEDSASANMEEKSNDQKLRVHPAISVDEEDETPAGAHNSLSKARYVFQLTEAKKQK